MVTYPSKPPLGNPELIFPRVLNEPAESLLVLLAFLFVRLAYLGSAGSILSVVALLSTVAASSEYTGQENTKYQTRKDTSIIIIVLEKGM